jgi:UDP-2,3-diacylglucosamine pyrophosphatase LpxH
LAIEPFAAWTPDPTALTTKLELALDSARDVFNRLGACTHPVTIIAGNHDAELALPVAQQFLLRQIPRAAFIDRDQPYAVGNLLVEHGNRYDGANENDWPGIHASAAAQSRGESIRVPVAPSAGSSLVEHVVSPLKKEGYDFLDMLQPEGELTALLLIAFEPGLIFDIAKLRHLLRARRRRTHGPTQTALPVASLADGPDAELQAVFGDVYNELFADDTEVGFTDLAINAWRGRRDGLSTLVRSGKAIPDTRLTQIRVSMKKILDEHARSASGSQDLQTRAAHSMASSGKAHTVVMGHTHEARTASVRALPFYMNTGTWTDRIDVPPDALSDTTNRSIDRFIRSLLGGGARIPQRTWADITLSNNRIVAAHLGPSE